MNQYSTIQQQQQQPPPPLSSSTTTPSLPYQQTKLLNQNQNQLNSKSKSKSNQNQSDFNSQQHQQQEEEEEEEEEEEDDSEYYRPNHHLHSNRSSTTLKLIHSNSTTTTQYSSIKPEDSISQVDYTNNNLNQINSSIHQSQSQLNPYSSYPHPSMSNTQSSHHHHHQHHRHPSDETIAAYPHPSSSSSAKPYHPQDHHLAHPKYYHQDSSDDSLDHQTIAESSYLPINPKSNHKRYEEEEEDDDYGNEKLNQPIHSHSIQNNIPNHEFDHHHQINHQNRSTRFEPHHHKYPPDSNQPNPSLIRPAVWKRIFWDTSPIEMRIWNHQQGIGIQERAYVCYLLAFGMLIALILELITNAKYQGTPIATKPSFNYMIGPSAEILINTGARFTPCIKYVSGVSNISFPCLNDTSSVPTCSMPLEEVCGFGGFNTPGQPDQTFRFILPMFLHAGVIHYAINILVQMTSSALIERQMGSIRFLLLYIPSGIFGFILGGNFSLVGQPSVGASGAIFSTHAAVLVDLVAHWSIEDRPARKLFFLLFEIIAGLALGLIPGIDNFSHIGGFAMGLLLSLILFPVLHQTKIHRISFYAMRLVCLLGAILMFSLLYRNFFTEDPAASCSWCRYLSCWPTQANNRCKGTGLGMTEITTTSPNNSLNGWPVLLVLALGPKWILKSISDRSFRFRSRT